MSCLFLSNTKQHKNMIKIIIPDKRYKSLLFNSFPTNKIHTHRYSSTTIMTHIHTKKYLSFCSNMMRRYSHCSQQQNSRKNLKWDSNFIPGREATIILQQQITQLQTGTEKNKEKKTKTNKFSNSPKRQDQQKFV